MDNRRTFALLFAAISILAIVVGDFTYTQLSFLNSSEKTSGTVVDLLWKTVNDEDGTHEYCYPIIEYVFAKSGTVITGRHDGK